MQAPPTLGERSEPGARELATELSGDRPTEVLPRVFERLTLLKHLARGGMGEVYLAASGAIEGAERPCVVKIIRREHADDRSFLARFLDEARIQAQLYHPGVAQIVEAATDAQGKPYVLVEYIEGRNMGEVRARAAQLGTRIAWPDAVAIALSLGDGLAHVHERTDAAGRPLEIVHRDLSPQNVMLGYAGDVKLIDFGTARAQNRRCHTVAGIVFAKPGYVAPEVANNNPGGVPADLYAFGVMLWELVAGRRFLFGDPSAHLAAVAAGKRSPARLASVMGSPPELDSIIGRLTAVSIEDRYADARSAVTDLLELLKQAPSLADGVRSVRGRIARLMERLYPAEPSRSRAEFARLVEAARKANVQPSITPPHAASMLDSLEPALAEPDPNLLPGTSYRIEREIGRGGAAIVYEARHLELGRSVALKVLNERDSMRESGGLEHFRREAQIIAALSHDNLVKLYEFDVADDGRAYYVMDLLEGESLDRRLQRESRLEWWTAVALCIQACRALEVAHAAGVVHRDIKPGNMFVTRSGQLKLLDFGIAKAGSVHEVVGASTDASRPFAVVGTPEYLAPEQAAGRTADPRSDIYALGAVLYELVTGDKPHSAQSMVALLNTKLHRSAIPPRVRVPKLCIPKNLEQTIMTALHRHPEFRFQNAAEFRRALEEALAEPERTRRRRLVVGSIAAAALTLAAGGLAVLDAVEPGVRSAVHDLAAPLGRAASGTASPRVQAVLSSSLARAVDVADTALLEIDSVEDEPRLSDDAARVGHAKEPAARTPTSNPLPLKPTEDPLGDELATVDGLLRSGKDVRALHLLRKLAETHEREARVLSMWSRTAAKTKAWGEALNAASKWAAVADDREALLHLARMQRVAGRSDDMTETLRRLLEADPKCAEAEAMLRTWGNRSRSSRGS